MYDTTNEHAEPTTLGDVFIAYAIGVLILFATTFPIALFLPKGPGDYLLGVGIGALIGLPIMLWIFRDLEWDA